MPPFVALNHHLWASKKFGFICSTCDQPIVVDQCKCDISCRESIQCPAFQWSYACPCWQSIAPCLCTYRYVDYGPGPYALCEWTTTTRCAYPLCLHHEKISVLRQINRSEFTSPGKRECICSTYFATLYLKSSNVRLLWLRHINNKIQWCPEFHRGKRKSLTVRLDTCLL